MRDIDVLQKAGILEGKRSLLRLGLPIIWQRRVELWGENGDRWLTLKRLNLPCNHGELPRPEFNQGPYTSKKEATNLDPEASNFNMYGAGLSEEARNIPANSNKWQWLIPNQELSANPLCKQNPL